MVVCAKGGNVGGSSYAYRQPQEVSMIFYVCAPGPHRQSPTKLVAPLGNDYSQIRLDVGGDGGRSDNNVDAVGGDDYGLRNSTSTV